MSISTEAFPLSMTGLSGGPRFHTDIIQGRNGQEVRNALWQDALWSWNASYAVKSRADAEALYAFFLNRYGKEQAFHLQAGADYTIGTSAAPATISANSSAGTYQLTKPYVSGSDTYYRTILRPSSTASDVAVYAGATLLTNGSNYTYSSTTGVITVASGGGSGTPLKVWVKKFYTVVRFDSDQMDLDMLTWWVENSGTDYSLHQPPDIPMVEVRDLT